jgi:hypothetical protein
MRARSIVTQVALAVALTAGFLGATTGAANAAGWHGIEGTVYSAATGKDWFHSTTERIKEGTSNVRVQFGNLPKAGITFKIRNASNATLGSAQSWTAQETDLIRTLSTSVAANTRFYTSFKQYNACSNCSPYSFTGSLYY